KIGEGAFGKAYLMRDKQSNKMVVVKETCLVKMSLREREDARREVSVLAQLHHPTIVTYYDSFEGKFDSIILLLICLLKYFYRIEHGNLYIIMDYCDGGDLAVKINTQSGKYFGEDQ